jgi:hypothetical protein
MEAPVASSDRLEASVPGFGGLLGRTLAKPAGILMGGWNSRFATAGLVTVQEDLTALLGPSPALVQDGSRAPKEQVESGPMSLGDFQSRVAVESLRSPFIARYWRLPWNSYTLHRWTHYGTQF